MKENDIPAFPTDAQLALKHDHYEGMTLRDYFAGQTLIGLISDAKTHEPQREFAKQAYMYADAMLEERTK